MVAAFPDEVIQALVLRVPEVGSKMEAHLAEKLSEAAVAVLDIIVGGKIHIEGGPDLPYTSFPLYLQCFLEPPQCFDTGECKNGLAGQGADSSAFLGPFRHDYPGSGQPGQNGPALRTVAVSLLRTEDPAERLTGDQAAPDQKPLDLLVEFAQRDQVPYCTLSFAVLFSFFFKKTKLGSKEGGNVSAALFAI